MRLVDEISTEADRQERDYDPRDRSVDPALLRRAAAALEKAEEALTKCRSLFIGDDEDSPIACMINETLNHIRGMDNG